VRNLIYHEYWNLSCPRKHILRQEHQHDQGSVSNQWSHTPCTADPRAKDNRFDDDALEAPPPWTNRADSDAAPRRLKSEWCWHWPCEELNQHRRSLAADGVAAGTRDGILDMLRTCKRM
jgi:hypothetical protein